MRWYYQSKYSLDIMCMEKLDLFHNAYLPITRFILYFGIFLCLLTLAATKVHAASLSSGIATYFSIQGGNISDGDIISFSPKGHIASKTEYDPYVIGVINLHPAVSLISSGPTKTYPVITTGNVFVRVSSVNGNIVKGDLITTSLIPGIGMKATKSGYVLGAALEGYSSKDKHAIGKIAVALDAHFSAGKGAIGSSLFDILNLSRIATYEEPTTVIRYILVAIIVIVTFAAGFFIFEKTVTKGIDAIGRNPLASHIVQLGMAVNILITLAITLGGLFIAYIVLRL